MPQFSYSPGADILFFFLLTAADLSQLPLTLLRNSAVNGGLHETTLPSFYTGSQDVFLTDVATARVGVRRKSFALYYHDCQHLREAVYEVTTQ